MATRLNLTMPGLTPNGIDFQEYLNDNGSLKRGVRTLPQVRQLRDKSAEIERAAMLRFQLEREHQQQLAAASAIQKLSSLDVTDPNYALSRSKILSEHTDAWGSPVFQKVLGAINQDYDNYQSQQKNYQQELFQATTAKRLSAVA